jgi:signal transduction histidine kinase
MPCYQYPFYGILLYVKIIYLCITKIKKMKKLFILVVCMFVFLLSINSQANIDSLERIMLKSHSDLEKVKALNILSYESLFKDSTKANRCMKQLVQIAAKTRVLLVRAEAYRALADQYVDLEDYEKATSYYYQARQLFKSIPGEKGQIGYARTLLNLGIIPHIHGDFKDALLLYSEAEPILIQYNQNRFLVNIYNKKCDVYEQLHQKSNALEYAIKAIELSKVINDKEALVRSYYSYAANSPDSKLNITYLNLARSIVLKYKLPRWLLYYYYFNTGGELYKANQSSAAIDAYHKAIISGFDEREKMSAALAISQIYIKQKSYNKAETMLDSLSSCAHNLNLLIQIRDICSLQITIDSIKGDYQKAYLHLRDKEALSDSILDFENNKQITYLNAKYLAVQRESVIEKLNAESHVQNIELTNKDNIVGMFVVVFILLTGALVLIFSSLKRKRLLADQLIIQLQKDKQLEATQAVLRGEVSERTRIARDLHDGLGGLLFGAKLILGNVKGKIAPTDSTLPNLNQAILLLDNSIVELRRVSHNMMPENLVHFGLINTLADFCSELNFDSKLATHFSFFGDEKRIDLNIELIAFRIAQELVNNAIKHAHATEINVQLVKEADRISLTVQDNGVGFDVELVNDTISSGLMNIRSRVDSLGGQLSIFSEFNRGTEVTVVFGIATEP